MEKNLGLPIFNSVCSLVLKISNEKINSKKRKYFAVIITNKLTSLKTNIIEEPMYSFGPIDHPNKEINTKLY